MPAIVKELVQVVRRVRSLAQIGREQHAVVEENGEKGQQDQRQHKG